MLHRFLAPSLCAAVLSGGLLLSSAAAAGPSDAALVRTRAEPGEAPVDLAPLAAEIDVLLEEAVQDFGLSPQHFAPCAGESACEEPLEEALVAAARESVVFYPRLTTARRGIRLYLTVVQRGQETLRVGWADISAENYAVRVLSLVRELLSSNRSEAQYADEYPLLPEPQAPASKRSSGRAVLALHAAALGGYVGLSLQRASGSTDARLTYPLAALGAGVGLGSAVVVADEWDITTARAWYLGAAGLWPIAGTLLALEGRDLGSEGNRYLYGLLAATGGLTLATVGLSTGEIGEGGAAMAHSGALLGMVLGGLTDRLVAGDADGPPSRGMGWGALAGVALAGGAASQLSGPSASDWLFVDLSGFLGGLAGAALASPLLVSAERSRSRDRLWLTTVMVTTVTGAAVGYVVTQPAAPSGGAASGDSTSLSIVPQLGFGDRPLIGLSVSGLW